MLDLKTKRYNAKPTIELMRESWEKSSHPMIKFFSSLHCPRPRTVKNIKVPRAFNEHKSSSSTELFVNAVLYYYGPEEELLNWNKVLFVVPGGGFVAMSPRHHNEYLCYLSHHLKLPIIAIDYNKAPEFPYPYALNQVFDAYATIQLSNGSVIGLNKKKELIDMVMIGDSAGGNLAAAIVLKILTTEYLTVPFGLALVYPLLSFDIQGWISHEYRHLFRNQKDSEPSIIEESVKVIRSSSSTIYLESLVDYPDGEAMNMSSRMRYLNDMILSPEFLLEMGKMYLGNEIENIDPSKDIFLSPLMAKDYLLACFPPTYIQTGDKDPLSDDSIIFAARMKKIFHVTNDDEFPYVQLAVYPGFSHGYFEMISLLPEAKQAVLSVGDYLLRIFNQKPFDPTAQKKVRLTSDNNHVKIRSSFRSDRFDSD